jgi:hypothetical protein
MGGDGGVRSQGLHLGLLVETEHHGAFGRVHVEPHHVDELLFEVRVRRDFEAVGLLGFQTVVLPDARDRVVTDPHALG